MDFQSPAYKDLISHINIKRGIDSIGYFDFSGLVADLGFYEFENDINSNNDSIELNLIKSRAYKEALIMTLSSRISEDIMLQGMIREEQKTFGGSKLFYLNDKFDKILVVATPGSMEAKLNMVISRLNKINERVARLNSKIKKENIEIFTERQSLKDKRDVLANMINRNLKA